MRIEETARLADLVETSIRQKIPGKELNNILDNLGLPYSPMNTMHSTSGIIGAADGDIMVTLNEDHHPTADYVRELREQLPREFPGTLFYFLPADITTQILNFGLPAPIDIQLQSNDVAASTQQATSLARGSAARSRAWSICASSSRWTIPRSTSMSTAPKRSRAATPRAMSRKAC